MQIFTSQFDKKFLTDYNFSEADWLFLNRKQLFRKIAALVFFKLFKSFVANGTFSMVN